MRKAKNELKLEIRKGVPIPEQLTPLEEQIRSMEVGDCFSLVNPSASTKVRIRSAFRAVGAEWEWRGSFGGTITFWRTK